jgi:hypothetical protein
MAGEGPRTWAAEPLTWAGAAEFCKADRERHGDVGKGSAGGRAALFSPPARPTVMNKPKVRRRTSGRRREAMKCVSMPRYELELS